MLQVFYIGAAKVDWDVALVAIAIYVSSVFSTVSSVSDVCCKCFI
jgi:hypothetical protein